VVFNQRFVGGFIIRHYGDPRNRIHAIQLELSQNTYMDETDHTFAPEKSVLTMALINQLLDTLNKTQVF
jgi:N-formylglutamate amidohydrolase